ncbi:hypothetical protein H310_04160 [Aphanomyces invadans]|uniref:Uncharacterized protein n=1 Tax=Aphanomyces invadans TaxID=157072 RepID=A0A024UHQ3_9STRA|nr:hypothetical protein H310_04160 [Aphanomyces invadans]ETW05153.1 hypothetical protein H310_04160 [Aphanomyces invadans]|eukprot:XP_008866591.1 hypothetical protein H310_04160 [Aphanomyces invadans]
MAPRTWMLRFALVPAAMWTALPASSHTTVVVPDPSEADNIEQLHYDEAEAALAARQVAAITDFQIDLNYYEYSLIPAIKPDYTIGIIVDPCKTREPGCCQDQFGSPAYIVPRSDMNDKGIATVVNEFGDPLDKKHSRLGDTPSVFDPTCRVDMAGKVYKNETTIHPNGSITHAIDYASLCVAHDYAAVSVTDRALPACWDNNATVNALLPCYTFAGRMKPHCVSVGYMQTAYIVQCNGPFALDNHCGTFLELHKPHDETILSQTRLFGEFTSGYRTTTLPLFYKGNRTRTVCNGDYEIWWVVRTRYKFVVKFMKKLFITTPLCEFDDVTNDYRGYKALGTA